MLAKAVANTTASLVLKVKQVSHGCHDQNLQNQVISSATQCAQSTSQLVACTKVRTGAGGQGAVAHFVIR